MSAIDVSAEEMASVYRTVYCIYAACMILIYDWFLCLGDEVKFVWNSDSGLTGTSLVYASSRYMLFIQTLLAAVTNYPMSDLVTSSSIERAASLLTPCESCRAVGWTQNVTGIVAAIAFAAFSALRAYALSNKNKMLAVAIVFLALPPTVMRIIQRVNSGFENLPMPFNCSSSNTLSPTLTIRFILATRVSQLAAELLVVIITWWYTYQSYRLRNHGIKGAKTISSLLVYNGSIYFLFLATLYIIDIIFSTATVPDAVLDADGLLELFYDPITSILVCHFILSLRRFDASAAATTHNGTGSESRGHARSVSVLHFAAQQSDTLPYFIASFAQPIHTDAFWFETDRDSTVDDDHFGKWQDMELGAVTGKIHRAEN